MIVAVLLVVAFAWIVYTIATAIRVVISLARAAAALGHMLASIPPCLPSRGLSQGCYGRCSGSLTGFKTNPVAIS